MTQEVEPGIKIYINSDYRNAHYVDDDKHETLRFVDRAAGAAQ